MEPSELRQLIASNATKAHNMELNYKKEERLIKRTNEVNDQNVELIDQLLERIPTQRQLVQEHIQILEHALQVWVQHASKQHKEEQHQLNNNAQDLPDKEHKVKKALRQWQEVPSNMDKQTEALQTIQNVLQSGQAGDLLTFELRASRKDRRDMQFLVHSLGLVSQKMRAMVRQRDTQGLEQMSEAMLGTQSMLQMAKPLHQSKHNMLSSVLQQGEGLLKNLQDQWQESEQMQQDLQVAKEGYEEYQQFCQEVCA